jgi:hypothetical protein
MEKRIAVVTDAWDILVVGVHVVVVVIFAAKGVVVVSTIMRNNTVPMRRVRTVSSCFAFVGCVLDLVRIPPQEFRSGSVIKAVAVAIVNLLLLLVAFFSFWIVSWFPAAQRKDPDEFRNFFEVSNHGPCFVLRCDFDCLLCCFESFQRNKMNRNKQNTAMFVVKQGERMDHVVCLLVSSRLFSIVVFATRFMQRNKRAPNRTDPE